jgi:hypothetical protein
LRIRGNVFDLRREDALRFFLERKQRTEERKQGVDTPTAIAINPRSSLRLGFQNRGTLFHWMKMQYGTVFNLVEAFRQDIGYV